jgi:tryptophan-rich sensory protein
VIFAVYIFAYVLVALAMLLWIPYLFEMNRPKSAVAVILLVIVICITIVLS